MTTFLAEACEVLGWQGGTIHQVMVEIARLRRIKEATHALMDHLHFRASVGGFKPKPSDEQKLAAVMAAFRS